MSGFSFPGGGAAFPAGSTNSVAISGRTLCGLPIEVRVTLGAPGTAYVTLEDAAGIVLTSGPFIGVSGPVDLTLSTAAADVTAALYTDNTRATLLKRSAPFSVSRDPALAPLALPQWNGMMMNARDAASSLGISGFFIEATTTTPAQEVGLLYDLCIGIVRREPMRNGVSYNPRLLALQQTAATVGHPLAIYAQFDGQVQDTATTFAGQRDNLLAGIGMGINFRFMSGPNEPQGSPTHGPYDTIDYTGAGNYITANGPSVPQVVALWAEAMHEMAADFPAEMAGIKIVSAGLEVMALANYPLMGDHSPHVDFTGWHYYPACGPQGTGQPSLTTTRNLTIGCMAAISGAINATTPGLGAALEECGGATIAKPGGGQTTYHEATGVTMMSVIGNLLLDFFAIYGPNGAVILYDLADGGPNIADPEGNFGMFLSSTALGPTTMFTRKPGAGLISAWQNLLSLDGDFHGPRAMAEWAKLFNGGKLPPFVPGMDPHTIAVSGNIPSPTTQGWLLFALSDGSSVLMIGTEPAVDLGDGVVQPVTAVTVTVRLALTQRWQLFDLGSATALTPIASDTTGNSTGLTLQHKGVIQAVKFLPPDGYTAALGDPRLLNLKGRAPFGGVQAVYAPSVNASGEPQAITIAPPSGAPWTPGNKLLLFPVTGYNAQAIVPGKLLGFAPQPGTPAGVGTAATVAIAPILAGLQTFEVDGMSIYSRVFAYETSSEDDPSLVCFTGAASLNISAGVITLNGLPDFTVAAGFRPGTHLVGVYVNASSPSGAYGAGTSTGARIVAKAPPSAGGNSSEQYNHAMLFDIDQTGAVAGGGNTATFSCTGLSNTYNYYSWIAVPVQPKFGQALPTDVRAPAA